MTVDIRTPAGRSRNSVVPIRSSMRSHSAGDRHRHSVGGSYMELGVGRLRRSPKRCAILIHAEGVRWRSGNDALWGWGVCPQLCRLASKPIVSAEMLRIGIDLQQTCRTGLEQKSEQS